MTLEQRYAIVSAKRRKGMMTDEKYVTWPELLEWAKSHGAINDKIQSISMGARHMDGGEIRAIVTMTGNAHDENGRAYAISDGEGKNRVATWTVTDQILKSLP